MSQCLGHRLRPEDCKSQASLGHSVTSTNKNIAKISFCYPRSVWNSVPRARISNAEFNLKKIDLLRPLGLGISTSPLGSIVKDSHWNEDKDLKKKITKIMQ